MQGIEPDFSWIFDFVGILIAVVSLVCVLRRSKDPFSKKVSKVLNFLALNVQQKAKNRKNMNNRAGNWAGNSLNGGRRGVSPFPATEKKVEKKPDYPVPNRRAAIAHTKEKK